MLLKTTIIAIVLLVQMSDGRHHHHKKHHKHKRLCYADTENPYLYFSSKTSYKAIFNHSDADYTPDGCKPIQVWMLIRHGTRYPLKKKIQQFTGLYDLREDIVVNYEEDRGSLCEKDIENLKTWELHDFPVEKSDQLTEQGYSELGEMGKRTKLKFKSLFTTNSEDKYTFEHTIHKKTKDSAHAFANGFFGREVTIREPTNDDLLPSIYPNCHIKPMKINNDLPQRGKKEMSDFKRTAVYEQTVDSVSNRLGFIKTLPEPMVRMMYDMCRYMKSSNFTNLSPWCACFSQEELEVLEYSADLAYYYNSGHGYSGNARTGCPLAKDLFDRFQGLVSGKESNQPLGVFYFGHSTTMYNLIASLEIIKDPEHITHTNYEEMKNRKWRTSLIAPFTGNFQAVLLSCDSGEKHRLMFYHNEVPFKFPKCHGYICSWSTFEDMYKTKMDPSTCNFNFCESDEIDDTETATDLPADEDKETTNTDTRNEVSAKQNSIKQNEVDNTERFVYRKVQKITKKEIPEEEAAAFRKIMASNLIPNENDDEFDPINTPTGTYKPKMKELHISVIFITCIVCTVVFILCKHYRGKRIQMKIAYQNMMLTQFNKQ